MLYDYPDERCVLPLNPDRVLFAEDFVNYILKRLNVPYQCRSGIADHRDQIYNAFNPEIEVAASYSCYCHREDIDREFEEIFQQFAHHPDVFLKYIADLTKFVEAYPLPESLMLFCLKLSMMAGKFYKRGCLNAPSLAIQMILKFLNAIRIDQRGYMALNDTARSWTRFYVDLDACNMTPDTSSDSDRGNSVASNSPEREMGGEEGPDNIPEELSDDGMPVDAAGPPSEEAVSSSSDSESMEKTCDVKAGIIVKSSNSTSDYSLSGSYGERNSEDSSHPYEDTSSDEESKQNKKPSCSNSNKFDSDSKTGEKDPETVDCKDPSAGLLNEKR